MKSYLEQLEDELKGVWKNYNGGDPIKGAHTEIEIEPKVFIGDSLNAEIADVLAYVYISNTTIEDVNNGNVEITDEAIVLKDKQTKKPIAIIRNQKSIHYLKSKIGKK